jgi:hypothetical protein
MLDVHDASEAFSEQHRKKMDTDDVSIEPVGKRKEK